MSTAVGDEGGFAPNLPNARRGDRADPRGDRQGRLHRRARTWCSRSTARLPSSIKDGKYVLESEKQDARARREFADYLAELAVALPDRLDRGRHGRERLGGLEAPDRASSAASCSSSATTSSSPTRASCSEGIQPGRGQRDPDQGEPDRHADRDLRRDRARQARGLRHGDLAPLGRDRGHHHRRHRGRHRTRCRSRPARCRAPTASPSTTSCCASRKTSATR